MAGQGESGPPRTTGSDRRHDPSDEADERQLTLARDEGDCYQASVTYLLSDVAETGAKARTSEYHVGVAMEEAEGLYRLANNRFTWSEPTADQNCHLEVVIADAVDGRFLPHLNVEATIDDATGATVGPLSVPFVWHPGLYHYGRNVALSGDGPYSVAVDVAPAPFPRRDERNGRRYTEPVAVRFEELSFTA